MHKRGLLFIVCWSLLVSSATAVASTASSDVYREVVNSDRMVERGYSGDDVVVALIDTGIADVPELQGSVIVQKNFSAAPAAGDQYGHGTFVAGLIKRTAPGVKFVSVKLSGADGAVDITQVLAAMQWVVAHKDVYGIDIVNLSFGNDSKQSYRVSPLNFAVERAWDAGLVVVTSSGNAGSASGTVTKPGDDPLVITVGSSDDAGTRTLKDDTIPDFVSRGPTQDGLSKPDVVAPGRGLVSLRAPGSTADTNFPGARVGTTEFRGSGTSFSTGIVSGVVAQVLETAPDASPDAVKAALLASAHPVSGDATAQGSGSVDAARAAVSQHRAARQENQRSNGSGTLQKDRGSARLVLDLGSNELPLLDDLTAQNLRFDRTEYLASQWSASQWGASQWGASQWGASQWGASQWGASQWGASQWWASQWG